MSIMFIVRKFPTKFDDDRNPTSSSSLISFVVIDDPLDSHFPPYERVKFDGWD